MICRYCELNVFALIKVCFLTAGEIYYGIYADSFSSVDVKYFIRKPIENEELIKRVHQIITAN